MLRPQAARWFEVLAARDDATLVLEALARTGAVELETRGTAGLPADSTAMAPLLAQFAALQSRYGAYWPPAARCRPSAFPEAPTAALQRDLATLQAWAEAAEPVIRKLQRGASETDELRLWREVLAARSGSPLAASALAAAGPLVQVRLVVLPQAALAGSDAGTVLADLSSVDVLASVSRVDTQVQVLVVGPPAALQLLAERVSALKGRCHEAPAWLHAAETDLEGYVTTRLAALAAEQAAAQATLDALARQHGIEQALGDSHRLQWLLDNVHALEAGALLCWVTGWCSDDGDSTLRRALQGSGARALLRMARAPAGLQAPLLLRNPPWARPFELFSRALGMPSGSEADPSMLLAVAVPLMFGYMFGDVGQGLVLAAAGWWARDRWPVARLLMVGGVAAAVFGLLFGSVFGLHGLLPALWLHPLDAPLAVLVVPIAGGALLLCLGLLLDALAALWRGEGRRWLLTDAWLLLVYLALLAAFVDAATLPLAAAAALAYCAGHGLHAGRFGAALGAIGEALEKTVQLLINTLSFARVGAFALAHAGLSSAIVALMQAADSRPAQAAVLVLGNVLVIVLEAMVVSIQTTRLVLFEFFTRFMRGSGRAFRPLPPPPFRPPELSPTARSSE